MNLIRNPARREAGFSLVELMVGMVIGLMAIVVMFQVFEVTEGQRRTTTGAGDAQQNGVASLFLMERDARMAGYGFNYTPMFNCLTRGFYAPTGTNIDMRLLPVQILDGSAKGSDRITFTYGQSDSFALPGVLAWQTSGTPNYFRLADPRFQFNIGDLVVATEVPDPMTASTMKDCWITQVTGLPDEDIYRDRVQFGQSSYTDANGTVRVAEYTLPFALPVSYVKWVKKDGDKSWGGRLMNLGQTPTATTYSIDSQNRLVANNAFTPGNEMVISDNIVQLQAQYGFSAACPTGTPTNFIPCRIESTATMPGTIALTSPQNQWGDVMPPTATPADWRKVIAVRMAIVARSTTPERRNTAGDCTATTVQPVWQTTGTTLWVDADPDWMCFRYKVFELVVPIRNLMWYPDPAGDPVAPG